MCSLRNKKFKKRSQKQECGCAFDIFKSNDSVTLCCTHVETKDDKYSSPSCLL